jgi:glycolate oxidase FAD binding subunit
MAALLDAVRTACPVARPGVQDDAFAGRTPAVVAEPASTEQVAGLLAATAPLNAAVAVRGAGSKADLGAPARSLDLLVRTAGLGGVLEYDPGDLVVRAGAGLTLAALQERLAAEGQWLGLDPPEPGATLGGIVASAAGGPRRHRYGAVRDLLIGATFVLADGTCAKAGGKVVKNVAGYDLCKLLTGSLGTLAVLTELTFRLHPKPRSGAFVTMPVPDADGLAAVTETLRGSRLEPAAAELDLELGSGAGRFVLLFEGRPEVVTDQADRAGDLLGGERCDAPPGWGEHPWQPAELGLRVVTPPGAVPAAVRALARFADADIDSPGSRPARVRGRAAIGVLEAGIGEPLPDLSGRLARLREELARLDGTAVVTQALPGADGELDRWGPVRGLDLMRAVKDRFDPAHRLAPGRFVGGI